jgi:chromosomal replication initiator protein
VVSDLWDRCLSQLQQELNGSQFHTWVRPLQAEIDKQNVILYAPNQFVLDRVQKKYLTTINSVFNDLSNGENYTIMIKIGSASKKIEPVSSVTEKNKAGQKNSIQENKIKPSIPAFSSQQTNAVFSSNLNSAYTFDAFVEGKANQVAFAAAKQVSDNLGKSYNPFFIYGGVGLGKTHLMHAVGHLALENDPTCRVVYLSAEKFVTSYVNALRHKKMDEFKSLYRSLDALLIDDIQFFAGKKGSQEELFHTFNSLMDGRQQIILTCDRYPKEVEGLEERLISRFAGGISIAIEPPELEMRVAILLKKASQEKVELPDDVAFFIGQRLKSNVRELEGALKRVMASADFKRQPITLELTKEALKDLLALQDKLVSIDNIQKVVAGYYHIKLSDILSKKRTRSIARPRQMAMCLSKELTNHSLPEIGHAFGGLDHTTVLHAFKKIHELMESDLQIKDDYINLTRTLSN